MHAFADGVERTVVVPSPDGPGETARFRLRREGARLHVATDGPHPWRLRIGGPDARPHTNTAGAGVIALPCGD
ncbi:hypothetical protein [Streptomyces sp. B21-083]|uniref:hypothetical protein n=1 Tax=Streptomyces sp. B21-083 TaxID=3039410 RepID=UPI002FF0B088